MLDLRLWRYSPLTKTMNGKEQRDTLLVGDGPELAALYDHLKRPERVLGMFCGLDCPGIPSVSRLGDVADVPGFLEHNPQVSRIYCSMSCVETEAVQTVRDACKVRAVKFCAVLPVVNDLAGRFVPMHIGKQLLLTPQSEPLSRLYNVMLKRAVDLLISLLLLLTLFPVVYLCKYIIAKKKRLGAVMRVQPCDGPDGKVFPKLTFRLGEGDLPTRWTAMPQLLNVLVGQMSLVGPSPLPVSGRETVEIHTPRLERRFVKSGMTGWTQLRDREGVEVLRDDIWYVEHWSLWLDLRILFRSIF